MFWKRLAWIIQDNIFAVKIFVYENIIDPIKDWYNSHFTWNKKWVYGLYTIDEYDNSGNFWLCLTNDDIYVTPKDSYYELFKDFKNGTHFRCHWIWNLSKHRPQKIKDVEKRLKK